MTEKPVPSHTLPYSVAQCRGIGEPSTLYDQELSEKPDSTVKRTHFTRTQVPQNHQPRNQISESKSSPQQVAQVSPFA